ncbi:CRISPR-associated exonuclease Cas4 [archaeon MnTg01]|nr:CRISPR-associated exonuclease Cas4 [archaeon MnTg01]
MMGDRDYRQLIKSAIESIGRDIEPKIDPKDNKTIYIHEVVRCLRRSYYDRTAPIELIRTSFNNLMTGLLQKMEYGGKEGEYSIDDITLKGKADMIVDDAIIIFRSTMQNPESPFALDLLYLNACMWLFKKDEGVVVYLTPDGKEASFSLSKENKMFEELVRRVRVLKDLLEEKKVPILEPSIECSSCQYYERCFVKQKIGKQIKIEEMFGLGKPDKNNE